VTDWKRAEDWARKMLEAEGYLVHHAKPHRVRVPGKPFPITLSFDVHDCDLVAIHPTRRNRWVQVTAGSYSDASERKRKLEALPWNLAHNEVEVWRLDWEQDPSNKRRKMWYFAVYRLEDGWKYTKDDRLPVPESVCRPT